MSTSDSKLATRSDSFDEPPPPAPSLKHTVSEPVPKRAVLESEEDALRRMEGGLGPFPAAPAAPGPGLLRSASDDAALPRSPRSNSFASRRIWAQQRIPTLLRQASSNLANALPSLIARVTSIGDAAAGAVSVNEQFYCQICMCNEDRKEGYTLPCDHTFCRDCLAQYLTVKIKDAQVDLFKCPHVDDTEMSARGDGWHCSACTYFNAFADPPTERVTCGMCATEQDAPPREEPGCRLVIDDGDMENLLTAETLAKLARFQEIKGNKHYRECPRCQAPNTDGPTRLSNNLVCEKCGHNYCYVHSDQHVGRSCRQFEREHRAELKLAEAHIAQFTRPCPGCKRPIEKSSGCNHMTCPGCSTNFCWLCGRTIGGDTYPNHFAPWNVLGCPNMQMQDDLREGMTNREAACQACAWRLAYCPMGLCMIATIVTVMVVFGSISLAWFAVFSVICWCLCYAPAMACWRLFLVPCCKCDDDDLNLNNVEEIQSIFKYFPLLPCMAFMAILSPSD